MRGASWAARRLVRLLLVAALRARSLADCAAGRHRAPEQDAAERGRPTPGRPAQKVALFMQALRAGGGAACLLMVAKGLAARGVRVDLLVLHAGAADRRLAPAGVRVTDFGRRESIAALPQLLRYLKRERPDVLLANNPYPGVAALVAKAFFVRDLRLVFRYANTFSRQPPSHDSKLLPRFLPFADAIVTISRGAADDFKRSFPGVSHRVRYVPNAAVPPDVAEQAARPVTHPWFDDPAAPVVLSVGRLHPQKDQATLLRAFARVARSRPARLVVLGEGPERARLAELSRELNVSQQVQFPGDVRPAFPWMARARVFVLSSAWEGLSMVLLEAMACGTPVVATDCPHGPGEILEGGRWGRLAPPGDWRALADAILATLDDPVAPELLIARAGRWSAESGVDAYWKALNDAP